MQDTEFKIKKVLEILDKDYDKNFRFLDCENDWQFFIAVLLTPQTTDKKTNQIIPILFKKYTSYKSLAYADINNVQDIIKPLGFYKKKSETIIEASKFLEKNNGVIPNDMQELLSINGMGRKCASVILYYIHSIPTIIVDTHFARVNNRLGFSQNKNPYKIEVDIKNILKKQYWGAYSTLINLFAREICIARKPRCSSCQIRKFCKNPFF